MSQFPGFEPYVGVCADSVEAAWDSLSLSLSLSAPPLLALSVALKKKKVEVAESEMLGVGPAICIVTCPAGGSAPAQASGPPMEE